MLMGPQLHFGRSMLDEFSYDQNIPRLSISNLLNEYAAVPTFAGRVAGKRCALVYLQKFMFIHLNIKYLVIELC